MKAYDNEFANFVESSKALTKARDAARKAVWEVSPDAMELDEPTPDMYEFDAIDVLDPESEYSHVSIMQDPTTEDFYLVEHLRVEAEVVRQAEHETLIASLIGQMELIMQSSAICALG